MNGCSADTSDVIPVQVYDNLQAGTIVGTDTICYGFAASPIKIEALPSGGDGLYTYQWMFVLKCLRYLQNLNSIRGGLSASFIMHIVRVKR
jgi:hypothetical protein